MDRKMGNNLIVGTFVTVGLIGFVYILFNIGHGGGIFTRHVTFYAKYPDVKGLHYGSEVSLSGLRAGVVKQITIQPDNGGMLTVEISVNRSLLDRIRKDSIASIKTQGMLGDKYIEISIGSASAEPVSPGDTLSTLEKPDLFTKGGSMVDGISRTFDKGGDLESVLKNLNRVAGNLAVITEDIQKQKGLLNSMIYGDSGAKLNKSLESVDDILRKINSGEGTLGALVNDPTLFEDMKYLMGGAKRSSVLKYFMRSFIESGEEAQPKANTKGGATNK